MAIDLREDASAPAVPTGEWGRPVALRRPVEARPATRPEQPEQRSRVGFTGPQPAPPGARPRRPVRRAWRRVLAEGLIAAGAIAILAYVFTPRVANPGWAGRADPVVQSLLDDVTALSRSAGGVPPGPAVAALGSDLARSRTLGTPPSAATARMWAGALTQLEDADAAMRTSGTVGASVRAELTAAGDALLELALQPPQPRQH